MDVFEFHKKLHETLEILKEYGIEKITEDNLDRVKEILKREERVDPFVKEVIKNLRKKRFPYTRILDSLKRKLGVEHFDREIIEKLAEYMEKNSYSHITSEINKEVGLRMSRATIRKICRVILGDFYFIPVPQEHPDIALRKGKIPFVVLAVLQEIPGELEKVWDRRRVEMSALEREAFSKEPQTAKVKEKQKKSVYNVPSIKYLHKDPEKEKIIDSLPKNIRRHIRRTVELNEEIEKACKVLGLDPDDFLVDEVLHSPLKREKAFARVLLEAGENKATLLMERGVDQRLVRRAVELLEKYPGPRKVLEEFQKDRKLRRSRIDTDDLIKRLDDICESLGIEKGVLVVKEASDLKNREIVGRIAHILQQFENKKDIAEYLMNRGVPKELVEAGLKIVRKEIV